MSEHGEATGGLATAAGHEALLQFLYLAPVGLVQIAGDGTVAMINPMSAQLLMPYAPGADLTNLYDVLAPFAPGLRALAEGCTEAGALACDDLRVHLPPLGRGVAASVLSLRMMRLDPATLVVSLSDVTPLAEREAVRLRTRLEAAARIDPLTRLPTRAVALERVAAALARRNAEPAFEFAVVVVDCDRFDRINTTLGSPVGDELLRLVGERLSGAVRSRDGLDAGDEPEPAAARLGGDEFVLVLRDLREAADAERLARRLFGAIARPFTIGPHTIHLTASIGVVLRADSQGDAQAVLQDAKIAANEAKRAGGARVALFDREMHDRAARRSEVEDDLRLAIVRGELFNVYQPIVHLATGECLGFEALVRWRHPRRGIVPPIEFIEIAEESGSIVELGDFVLRESCRQLAAWRAELGDAAPGTISVNLSRAQLKHGGFDVAVRSALEAHGLPAPALQLEITESLAAQDAGVREQLRALKAVGVSLALDDFGTGYSSLSSLHLLPVDVVKIDRSFVSQAETSAHHRVLIEATVKVAKSLGMSTVAEGIETPAQAERLDELRCDKGQGYLYAKPLGAVEATRWLAERASVATSS